MREARQALGWLAILIAVVFAGDRALSPILNRFLLRSQFRFSRIYRGGNDAAILIIGDSRGVHSFYAPSIEKMIGRPVLNLSFNSMATRVAEALLADYLERNAPPRIVIIEVTSVTNDMVLAPELRTYAGLSPRLNALYAETNPRAATAGRVFRLLSFNSEFFLRALAYLRRSDQDWINRGTISPRVAATTDWLGLRPLPGNLEALQRTIQMLQRRGSGVRLVIAPYHPSVRTVRFAEFFDAVERQARRADPQLNVANYIGAVTDDALFADRVHMNADGSERFLRMLQHDGIFAPLAPAVPLPAIRPPR